ncbi:MAG: hypothetical protein JW797_01210 [Bradymonadales bacterium]|nr:hypothetical protein [Bradymonadales bacterium]
MTSPRGIPLVVAVIVCLYPAGVAASPPQHLLTQLEGGGVFVGGSQIVGPIDAQVRFRSGSGWGTADYDEDWEREKRPADWRYLFLDWDISFGTGRRFEIGARLEGAYIHRSDQERIGLEAVAIGGRFQAMDREQGPRMTVGLAVGKQLYHPGGSLLEAEVVLGFIPHHRLVIDLGGFGMGTLASGQDAEAGGGLAMATQWRPWQPLGLEVEVVGQVGSYRDQEDLGWELAGALSLGVDLGGGHVLTLSGHRTLVGARVEEVTGVMLGWSLRWSTEDGFLRLDRDSAPAEGTMEDDGAPAEEPMEDDVVPAEEPIEEDGAPAEEPTEGVSPG